MDPSGKDVLVVDDEPEAAIVVREMLEYRGHRVTCVLDSLRAVRLLQEKSFDVLITDMFMPDVDGAEIIRRAHQLNQSLRIVAVSGGSAVMNSGDVLSIAKKIGATVALEKPFTLEQLAQAVEGETAV